MQLALMSAAADEHVHASALPALRQSAPVRVCGRSLLP
jgi:hypothetical protein